MGDVELPAETARGTAEPADAPGATLAPSPAPPAADPADARDICAALEGDGEAYARLIERHQPAIGGYMWRFTRDRGQWEELVHEVFVESYLSLAGYRGDAPWLHWLKKIATRVGYRFWKRRSRLPTDTDPAACERLFTVDHRACEAGEAAEVVHGVLDRLAPRDRLVLTLFYLEGCTVAQIAQLTGWTATMVKVQTHRARGRLKKLLENAEKRR